MGQVVALNYYHFIFSQVVIVFLLAFIIIQGLFVFLSGRMIASLLVLVGFAFIFVAHLVMLDAGVYLSAQVYLIASAVLNNVLEEGNSKPTRILYRANLSHERLTRYLEELKVKGLINENQVEDGRFYTITPKGLDFVHEIKKAESFVAGFDLNI